MTKQEKLHQKAVLLAIIPQLLDSDAERIREEFPFIMQDDDDIEDDVEVIFIKDADDEGEKQAREFYSKYLNGWETPAADAMVAAAESISEHLKADVEFLEGAAVEYDYRRGLLFKSKALLRMTDEGLAVVLPHTPEEEKYFTKHGYKSMESLLARQTMNSDRIVDYHGVMLRASDIAENPAALDELRTLATASKPKAKLRTPQTQG